MYRLSKSVVTRSAAACKQDFSRLLNPVLTVILAGRRPAPCRRSGWTGSRPLWGSTWISTCTHLAVRVWVRVPPHSSLCYYLFEILNKFLTLFLICLSEWDKQQILEVCKRRQCGWMWIKMAVTWLCCSQHTPSSVTAIHSNLQHIMSYSELSGTS